MASQVVQDALSKGMSFDTHNQTVKQYAKLKMDLPLSVSEIKKFSSVSNVCIIGGGVSGVVTARILKDEGIPCTIFGIPCHSLDASRIRAHLKFCREDFLSWRSVVQQLHRIRHPGATSVVRCHVTSRRKVPSSLYEFPDKPHPPGWDFAAGEMINKYINDYAQVTYIVK